MKKSVIEKKSENLLNLSARDECICLLKIAKKNFIDLLEIFPIEEINELFFAKKNTLKYPQVTNENNLEHNLNDLSYKNYQDFINKLYKLLPELKLDEKVIDFLKLDEQKNIKWLINNILKYANIVSENLNNLFMIQKVAKKNINKKGIETLFVARYFLYFKTKDDNYVRAPLIFLPINIDINNKEINVNAEWVINEKLFTLLSKESDRDIDFTKKYTLDELVKLLNDLTGSDFSIKKPELFQDFTKQEYTEFLASNNYEIKDQVILGIFGINDAILYREINSLKKNQADFDPFDEEEVNFLSKDALINQEINDQSLLLVNDKSDIYQRYSIRSSLNQDTIIYGPPGTGKSQTIANLIINLLINDDTALIVSEKMTALNVILKRLKNLNIFFLHLTHYDNKNLFYDNFKYIKDVLQNDWYYENYNLALDKEKETTILSKLHNKQYDLNLKKFFTDFNNLIFQSGVNVSDLKTYYYLAQKLGAKYNVLKNNEFILTFYNKISVDLARLKLNEENFFNEALQIYQSIGPNQFKLYQTTSLFILTLLSSIPNLLELYGTINNKIIQNEISKLFASKVIDENDINYIKNNFFKLQTTLNELDLLSKLIPEQLKTRSYKQINEFYLHIKNLLDDKNLAYKYQLFLNGDNYLQELKGLKKLGFKNKGIDEKVIQYLVFVHKNIDVLNERFKLYLTYKDLLFDVNAWYFYLKELNDPLFLAYYEKQLYLFDVDFLKYFSEYNLTFNDCSLYLQINTYQNKLFNYFAFLNQNPLNAIYSKDTKAYETMSVDVVKLLFDLMVVRLRMKLAQLSKVEKKEMQLILATGNLTKRPDIFRFINEHQALLHKVFPICLGTPENIARNLPLVQNSFDYGIFDEASQVYLERIYSIIYRTKIKIVAGDDKQIQPMTYFSSVQEYDPDDDYQFAYDTDAAKSLLEKAKSLSWNEFMLKNHYRSDNEQLIKFSNMEFYNNELDFASFNNELTRDCIQLFNLNGQFLKNGTNPIEANKVIELLEDNFDKYDSIMVITANAEQGKLVETLITKHPLLSKIEDERINVINLENIQGEEADLVIFDLTYAKRENSDNLSSNFGTINLKNGKYRINVAITRAKKEMFIVKSFQANEISNEAKNENVDVLKRYLLYVEEINEVKNYLAKDLATKINTLSNELKQEDEMHDDLFIMQFNKIRKNNIILKHYLIGSKYVDYVFFNQQTNRIELVIFIDDFKQEQSINDWLENIDFQRYLQTRGYKTFRINIYEWALRYAFILEQISLLLN